MTEAISLHSPGRWIGRFTIHITEFLLTGTKLVYWRCGGPQAASRPEAESRNDELPVACCDGGSSLSAKMMLIGGRCDDA